jgi:ABC-type uncharacterized transport system substrate-binding protein
MKKINPLTVIIFIFLTLLIIFFLYFSINKPRILILQSYATDYFWTKNVDVGIKRILSKHPYNTVRFHYMDTKNHPDEAFKKKAGILARSVVDRWQPNVIIAVDDDAQEYVAKYYVNNPHIKIVFSGVNGTIEPYGYDKANNAAGIVERKPLQAVKDALIGISKQNGKNPDKTPIKVINLGDTSGSVKDDEKFIKKFNWEPQVKLVQSSLVVTYDDWKNVIINDANDKIDFLLLSNYRKLWRSKTDKTLVPPKEVVKWTLENSRVPGITTNGFGVDDDGYMFAIGVSAFEQGEVAAADAIDIIENNIDPKKIKLQQTQEFTVHIIEKWVKKYNMKIPKVYEAFARVGDSYYSDEK